MSRYNALIAALLASYMVEVPTISDTAARELTPPPPQPPRQQTKSGKRERERRLRQLAKRKA